MSAMSSGSKKSPHAIDLISTEDDTIGSSISLSLGENSIRIKEKPKDSEHFIGEKNNEELQWWLKKPEVRLGSTNKIQAMDITVLITPTPSPDISSSMREFLEKEKMCKDSHKTEMQQKDRDDTLCDVLASVAFDKYPSDFENATDEDIGSILEEMSKIADALSPNSAVERTKSGNSGKMPTEEEKSVEELLEEAERLVRHNSNSLSKTSSKSDTLVPDNKSSEKQSLAEIRQLEADIFEQIEKEVQRESEKIKKSPKNEKKRETSPGLEITYEKYGSLKPPKSLDFQRKKFEEQKVEVSSSSDLDDPIDKHSKSEELSRSKNIEENKDNLQKEITDVDKDFFEDLLRKSKERAEGGMSGSSSLGQEDFSHFLKLLQEQSDKKEQELKDSDSPFNILLKPIDKNCRTMLGMEKTPEFPEKEITKILEKEFPQTRKNHEIIDTDSSPSFEPSRNKSHENENLPVREAMKIDTKVVNSKDELYTIDLTPRLELFADTIPKLLAEKSNGNSDKPATTEIPILRELTQQLSLDSVNFKPNNKSLKFSKSKSSDQISKPSTAANLRSSFENIKSMEVTKKPLTVISKKPSTIIKPLLLPKKFTSIKTRPPLKAKTIITDPLKNNSISILPLDCKESSNKSIGPGGDTKFNLSKRDWETLCREERHKNSLLKRQIESEGKLYKSQIENMRRSFEGELFALKKHNILLKSKIDELTLNEKKTIESDDNKSNNNKLTIVEKELEKQENLTRVYENENKKLIQDMKNLQEEMKNIQNKQKNKIVEMDESQRIGDRVKDLEEDILKLNLEISELREKNSDDVLKNDDLNQQNSLLADELKMFKDQLGAKDEFITNQLQSLTTKELDLKKQVEDLNIKLHSKSEQLNSIKHEFDKLQNGVLPLEKELLETRVKEQNLLDKFQLSKSYIEREKKLSQKLKDQVILDNKKIIDLNRQVKEMERILKRKNPDSVSALILTANSEQERVGLEKVKLFEERIVLLENEIKSKEITAQEKILEFQNKFIEMKDKYTSQVMDLENKLAQTLVKDRKISKDMFTQTIGKSMEHKSVETNKKEEKSTTGVKVGPKSQNPKEDTHLIATIRGLKLELTNKDKAILKLSKEFQESQKTNRKLQKEREKFLTDRKSLKNNGDSRSLKTSSDGNDQNSNIYQNGHASNLNSHRLISCSSPKLYDSTMYENTESNLVKRLNTENEILKEELNKINKDFMTLKNKRLHDLNLLQEEHEREMATLVKEYSIKFGDSKVVKLQGQISTQLTIISQLRQQMDKFRDYKEQVVVLKAERDHLETKVKTLNDKVKYLSMPDTEQLQLLQDKITILQQRHESREMTLQNLVRDLLRNRTQCKDCKGEKSKNRQLCYYRQELDSILDTLQDIANVH